MRLGAFREQQDVLGTAVMSNTTTFTPFIRHMGQTLDHKIMMSSLCFSERFIESMSRERQFG